MSDPTVTPSAPWQRLPLLSLRQLQYFVALAKLRRFTDTADYLSVSQPALSSALRKIEDVLGGKLLHRNAQEVTLTEQGAAVLVHAERLLNVAYSAFSDMQHIMQQGGGGQVRIGMVPSVSSLVFPALPQLLRQHFPTLHPVFFDHTNDSLVQALQDGALDIALGALDTSVPKTLEVRPLLADQFVAVIHHDDALAQRDRLCWRALSERDIALFCTGNISRLVQSVAESRRLNLAPRYQVDFLETLYGLVRSSLAVAILPRLYTRYLRDPLLVVKPLHDPVVQRQVVLMRSKVVAPVPEIGRCFDFLAAELVIAAGALE